MRLQDGKPTGDPKLWHLMCRYVNNTETDVKVETGKARPAEIASRR